MLDAAETLFVTQGFRATTMEGIAQAADMSKVTVYGYFSDKDAIFAAVAGCLATRLVKAVSAALGEVGHVRERVNGALIASTGSSSIWCADRPTSASCSRQRTG